MLLQRIMIPDIDDHKKRLMMDLNRDFKEFFKFRNN